MALLLVRGESMRYLHDLQRMVAGSTGTDGRV